MLPDNQKTIGCKWVFKINYNPNSSIERYKARLIVQKFSQVYGIDHNNILAPIIRYELLKIFQAIAITLKMRLIQIDVIKAYLESIFGQNKQPI